MDKKPKFIYFDLDDTLLDHRDAEANALADIHSHFELFDEVELDELVEVYRRINKTQWERYGRGELGRRELQRNRFEFTLKELGLDTSSFDEIGSRYMNYYRSHWSWIDGAREAYDAIRRKFDTGILTNGFTETQKMKFQQFGLYESARHLVISEEVGILKPEAGIFEYATRLAGCLPDEILYIGDSYNSDVIGGTSYGWNVAWFRSNGSTDSEEKADFVFNDFNKLKSYLGI